MNERVKLPAKERLAGLFTKPNIALIYIVLMLFVLAVKPGLNVVVAFAITPAVLYLFFHEEFYVLIAVFIFFYEQLIYVPGAPVFRIYSYLFFAKFIISKRKMNFNVVLLPAIAVIVLYAVFAMMNADVSTAMKIYLARNQTPPSAMVINLKLVFKTMADLSFVFMIAYIFGSDKQLFGKLFLVVVAAGVASGIYGFRANNVFNYSVGYSASTGAAMAVVRYMGSFNDPNYTGMFLNIALFAVLTLKSLKKFYVKIPLILILYYYIIASGSITALICNGIGWVVFLILRYRLKSLMYIAIAGISGVFLFFAVTSLPVVKDMSVVRNLEMRIASQFSGGIETEDSAQLTSGRTKNWAYYLEYFKTQDIYRKLFGGNIVLTSSLDPYFAENNGSQPHEAYIGFLMLFGIVGAAVMVLCFLMKNLFYVIFYLKSKDEFYMLLILCNFVWAFYGLSLDYFPDWKFMFFYFL